MAPPRFFPLYKALPYTQITILEICRVLHGLYDW